MFSPTVDVINEDKHLVVAAELPVDADHAEAKFDNGVLTVRLPKISEKEASKAHKIDVQ